MGRPLVATRIAGIVNFLNGLASLVLGASPRSRAPLAKSASEAACRPGAVAAITIVKRAVGIPFRDGARSRLQRADIDRAAQARSPFQNRSRSAPRRDHDLILGHAAHAWHSKRLVDAFRTIDGLGRRALRYGDDPDNDGVPPDRWLRPFGINRAALGTPLLRLDEQRPVLFQEAPQRTPVSLGPRSREAARNASALGNCEVETLGSARRGDDRRSRDASRPGVPTDQSLLGAAIKKQRHCRRP
jgi:hypothetical protein